ncbi:hypothetical protein [Cellulosimicrobium sp. TH-20]|uniref:hypothetical protein n=1 Tax=Cellulosimicrobium sp. TH-20 TaxID=1980001 RepID=UPI00119E1AF4|nr:hypothetical protein [Cellulosimicrobium sp. TH-20]
MTTNYTGTVTVADDLTDPDDVLDALAGYSPVWASLPPRRATVTLSVDAASLSAACTRLLALVEVATQSDAVRVDVTTSEEFDRENGVEPDPA